MNKSYHSSMFEYQEKGHKYFLDGKPMTGVTTILGVIAKPKLIQWAADEACNYVQMRLDKAGDTRSEWYRNPLELDEVLKEARKAHTKKKEAAGTKGTDVHSEVEGYIKACLAMGGDANLWDNPIQSEMMKKFVEWSVSNQVKFLDSEKHVYSKEWFVAGTFDFSFEKDGKRFIGDLKTMKKMWDRVPFFQTAAYRKMSIEMGEKEYDGSCIVNINKETNELTEHWSYDWEGDQKAFESALYLYRQLNTF